MADTVSITDISKQLNAASRLVVVSDWFWVLAADGSSVRIPAEFVRAYLTVGISPSVGDDGNWYINGKNLGVKAEGVTPQLRGGTLGIEVSYDKGATWETAVLYSDMDIDLDELEKQYKKTIEGEQQRVEHENTRQTNEQTRQMNEQTRQSNEQKRVDAANGKIASLDAAVTKANELIDNANQAAANAKDATSLAQTATTSANNASADAQAAEAQRAAAEAQRAAAYQKMTEGNAATISEMQRVVANITNAQSAAPMTSVPASIYTATELTAAVGETVSVAPSVFMPASCNRSVLYRVISDTGKVRYNGDVILPSDAADVVVEVIPALNNMAARVVTIHAVAPTPILDLAGEEITDERGEAITA